VKNHVRILLAASAVALALGWLGLRRGNAELAARAATSAAAPEAAR
jgi:hypothetical protein